jgi:nucleoside-diphosphate-sugar epimerase
VTRFAAHADGEPQRTNVTGTRRLLDWARRHDVHDFHLISSAYACGRTAEPVPEQPYTARPEFHNVYEQSKWEAEQLCFDASRRGEFTLTVYRPAIVVGHYASGRVTKLDGFYVSVRATELLARSYEGAPRWQRHAVPLRINGRGGDPQNIVPVDYVAAMIAAIHAEPQRHSRTYHLVHPDGPTNSAIKTAMESYFDIAGGHFVDPAAFDALDLNDAERLFREVSRPVAHYFTDTPHFLRANAARVEAETGITCPTYGEAALHRLFDGATAAASRARRQRRRSAHQRTPGPSPCATYFQRFLPARIALSQVARATAMDVTIRFIIDPDGGDWICRFDAGRLTRVGRAAEHVGGVDFGYRADVDTFFKAISGRAHPQEFFFGGGAEIFGDIERALKMAMILNAFSREHPCDRKTLSDARRLAC